MIEKMKKLTFLVTNTEYDSFIQNLRELGVVHVEQLQEGATSPELQSALDLEQRYRSALDYVAKAEAQEGVTVAPAPTTDPALLLANVESLREEEAGLVHQVSELDKVIKELTPWGDFDPASLKALEEATGYTARFWRCTTKQFDPAWDAIVVNEADKRTYFITFNAGERPDIPAEQLTLPAQRLQLTLQQKQEAESKLAVCRTTLSTINATERNVLEEGMRRSQSDISLRKVQLSNQSMADGYLKLMLGWVRADRTDALVKYLQDNHIFYEMENPAFEDDVPVEITEDSFSRLFVPILKMYSLPNYHEIDPTAFFAPFFMLFFGLCLGDGGYGLLVMLAGLAIVLKGGESVKDYGKLALWLGGSTVVCGLAMGTFFGIDLSQQDWAFLAPVKKYFISDNGIGPIFGYSPMMVISIIIGLIQVLLGMVLKAAKAWMSYGVGYAIGTLSWVVALLFAVLLFGLPYCGVVLPKAVQILFSVLIGIACIGIFLYNNPAAYKNPITGPLLNLGSGVYSVYSMATGLLGDLLSYIRLFALGLTGGVLGGVFNSLALDMTSSMPWYLRWLPMVIILLFGHGITFALSLISAFVHPMRLIFVEFFKNANFSGGGKAYQPFKQ